MRAPLLQTYPWQDVLVAAYGVPKVYDAAAIKEILDCLTPEQVRVMWASKKFEGMCPLTEPW